MNEIENSNIDQLTSEIVLLKHQTAQNIIEIGKKELGEKATLKQICNHVSPQIGITSKECRGLLMHIKAGGKSE